jgi:hypothetical protein
VAPIKTQSSLVMIQYPAKVDLRCLRFIDSKKAHTWVARFFSIYLTYEWFVFSTRSNLERRFEFKVMTIQIPWVFLNYILGLWLSTTKISLKYKKLSYFLLLPSLLMSPAIAGFPYDIMGWLSLFVAIWSYRIIYKTERPVS